MDKATDMHAPYRIMTPPRRRGGTISLACLLTPAVLAACASAGSTDQLEAAELLALDEPARRIVNEVLEDETLTNLCTGGEKRVRAEVRRETMTLVFTEGLSNPRDSGTAAGEFLAKQCKHRFPDYDNGPE